MARHFLKQVFYWDRELTNLIFFSKPVRWYSFKNIGTLSGRLNIFINSIFLLFALVSSFQILVSVTLC